MTPHILIVDDVAAIRDMVRMALEIEGFKVSDASNAHQANNLLEQEKIDLLLLDWMMPGISGIDFAGRIRREGNYQIGIIMHAFQSQTLSKHSSGQKYFILNKMGKCLTVLCSLCSALQTSLGFGG